MTQSYLLTDSFKHQSKDRTKKSGVHPRNNLNDLSGNTWLYFTKSIFQTSYPSEMCHGLRKEHYANKPPTLMKELIEFFTKKKQVVLDPFAGVGGTLLGANLGERLWGENCGTGCRINITAERRG